MKGFYYQFARLAIRLLAAIYWNQVAANPKSVSVAVARDAEAWLEKYK